MIERLEKIVDDITSVNSKLVLLIGPPRSGKTALLSELSQRRNVAVLNVGASLGRQLLTVPNTRRHLQAADLMKDLTDETAREGLLLLDNIELLFDRTLLLNPLDFLKRHAHSRRVISVWPGEIQDGRLSYSRAGHPEYQDYGIEGLVPFEIN